MKAFMPRYAAGITSTQACFTIGTSSSRGKFDNEPTDEAALKDRIVKLERLVGRISACEVSSGASESPHSLLWGDSYG